MTLDGGLYNVGNFFERKVRRSALSGKLTIYLVIGGPRGEGFPLFARHFLAFFLVVAAPSPKPEGHVLHEIRSVRRIEPRSPPRDNSSNHRQSGKKGMLRRLPGVRRRSIRLVVGGAAFRHLFQKRFDHAFQLRTAPFESGLFAKGLFVSSILIPQLIAYGSAFLSKKEVSSTKQPLAVGEAFIARSEIYGYWFS